MDQRGSTWTSIVESVTNQLSKLTVKPRLDLDPTIFGKEFEKTRALEPRSFWDH